MHYKSQGRTWEECAKWHRIQEQWVRAMYECHYQERAYSIFKHPFFPGRFTLFYKGE